MAKKKKYKGGKKNPAGMGDALMVVNAGEYKKYMGKPNKGKKYGKRNPFALGSPKQMVSGVVDKYIPLQLGGLGGGAFVSRWTTAKILKANDVGIKSVGVQSALGLLGGVTIKAVLKQALLGRFFFLGSVFHAGWRAFTTEVLSKNLVDGFQYGDVLLKAPAKAVVPEEVTTTETVSGVYEEVDEDVGGVGEAGYEEAY